MQKLNTKLCNIVLHYNIKSHATTQCIKNNTILHSLTQRNTTQKINNTPLAYDVKTAILGDNFKVSQFKRANNR